MPRLQAKVEGKGNGVKTVIPNMVEVARALGRPPTCKKTLIFLEISHEIVLCSLCFTLFRYAKKLYYCE